MPESPDRLINQRYAVVRLLGEGGMGSVYLVRDTYQGGRQIALKFLRAEGLNSETVELFKEEFRSMARLRHPNLAEVYDFGTIEGDGRHFLTMEYVKGEDLGRQGRAELVERFDSLAVQGLRALDYIHSRGLLHNDIKPHNIMIHPPFQVKLLDFGLAHGQAESARPGLSGTLHYIAPERFGDKNVDERSDLYSLGVILYEVLTGSLPYQGKEPGQVVGAILRGEVRPPRLLNSAVPERLEAFVMALMERAPASRPASAAAALDRLNTGLAQPHRIDTPETYASFVTSGRFVGRDRELSTLMMLATEHVLAAEADDRLPRLVLLSGPSGIGKSRLLRELKHRLQLAGIRNLTGRCYEDGGVPFHPFVEVLRQLARPPELPSELRAVVDQLVPPETPAGQGQPTGPGPAERLGKKEFIRAVGESLMHMAQGVRGVVFLEDLHWSDAPGVDLLEHLMKALAEEGTLRRHGRAWIAESRMLDAIRLPPSLASAVVKRLSALAAGERLVVEVLAVFNRPADAKSIAPATGLDEKTVEDAIEGLNRLRLVALETEGDGRSVIGLAHSRIREAIYKEIPEERRRALHRAVGVAIEEAHASSIETIVEELAHHFTAAVDRARAADFCLRAARKANALFYPQRELQFLVQALEFLPEGDTARRFPALRDMSWTQANDLRDHEGAVRTGRLLRDEARKVGDTVYEAIGLREMSWSLGFMGDVRAALENGRRSLALMRSAGNK